jgi:hypothetical protein
MTKWLQIGLHPHSTDSHGEAASQLPVVCASVQVGARKRRKSSAALLLRGTLQAATVHSPAELDKGVCGLSVAMVVGEQRGE